MVMYVLVSTHVNECAKYIPNNTKDFFQIVKNLWILKRRIVIVHQYLTHGKIQIAS